MNLTGATLQVINYEGNTTVVVQGIRQQAEVAYSLVEGFRNELVRKSGRRANILCNSVVNGGMCQHGAFCQFRHQ